ncbi:MAG: alpha/beta fold hydrolase [Azoarcus sp.]|nr:alpha/beta fold hydrolase [Azoarcus sp.]
MNKTPLVFLHGWGMAPAVWRPITAALGTENFDIHTPALPGHGGNPAHVPATLTAWAETLAPVLPSAAVVVGWSLGALLALELARVRPKSVSRLFLIGATPCFVASPGWPHGLDPTVMASFSKNYALEPKQTLRRFLTLQTLGEASRRQWLPLLDAAAVPHTEQPLPALADGLKILTETDLRPQIAAIRQPVRLIHGQNDALMPCGAAHWLSAALPRARLDVLDNCGHTLPLSRADNCVASLRAALNEGVEP